MAISNVIKLATAVLACGLFAACASNRQGVSSNLAKQLVVHDIVLLGEVHDNAQAHRQRTQALQQAMQDGWRPIIAMEQFDRQQQARLDEAMQTCTDAQCVIQKAAPDAKGWEWAYYEPVIDLALKHGLRVLAANLSRADAASIMQHGFSSVFSAEVTHELGLDAPLPLDLLQVQEHDVQQGHCGLLPEQIVNGMAQAQIARDAVMAFIVRQASQGGHKPVVLLAGNGHILKQSGVPRWLGHADVFAVGFTETPAASEDYDYDVVVPAFDRTDQCEALRRRFPSQSAS
ncbi:ChaN family lipoprotein [Pusillimonas sp. ANT_WB101]|uniref:ChaN family lipoprotein n=1 Tax=Pusillimonas sp. ANT_WB101 TaxID=2597356 RepID=UPI0011EE1C12|nr:ChaN family lipoprotein [Pusillimonas sp. ANT_WB101]KAA0890762.1 ChaN family lipoprotein [Pusillimonas sp. ANT_WB101]